MPWLRLKVCVKNSWARAWNVLMKTNRSLLNAMPPTLQLPPSSAKANELSLSCHAPCLKVSVTTQPSKEAASIIEAVRIWGHYLYSRPFTLITDQRSCLTNTIVVKLRIQRFKLGELNWVCLHTKFWYQQLIIVKLHPAVRQKHILPPMALWYFHFYCCHGQETLLLLPWTRNASILKSIWNLVLPPQQASHTFSKSIFHTSSIPNWITLIPSFSFIFWKFYWWNTMQKTSAKLS